MESIEFTPLESQILLSAIFCFEQTMRDSYVFGDYRDAVHNTRMKIQQLVYSKDDKSIDANAES